MKIMMGMLLIWFQILRISSNTNLKEDKYLEIIYK